MNGSRELKPGPNSRSAAEGCSVAQPGVAPAWCGGAMRLWLSILREIFDESAYSRFLARREVTSSQSAYAAFLREQEGIKARRPKCC
jgi:hypothetical protein